MEVKYRNDLYGNYMLIEIPYHVDCGQYSFKMIEKNKIPGILSCKERMEDGQGYWYVDISKKKSLAQEYKDKEMQLEEMFLIFQQICTILEELRIFLLNESMVIMDPEYIFKDIEDDSLFLLVVPWNDQEQTLHKLAEFFLEKMNHKDENGVNAAYLFYRQQSESNFSLYQFLPILEKENILKRQKKKELDRNCKKGLQDNNILQSEYYSETEKEMFSIDSVKESKIGIVKENTKRGSKIIFLLLFVLLFVFSFLPEINSFLQISIRAVSVLLFVIFLLLQLFKSQKKENPVDIPLEEKSVQKMDIGMKETVFFNSSDEKEYLKLQWIEKGRKKQFVLKDFPCTVGKIKEEVSLCISDISVSRIHCKFIEKEGKAAIVDMNSTNGTFLNGLPVKNGEILEIEKNDEILIGKVTVNVV